MRGAAAVPLVIFSELTPWSDAELSRPQLRVHRAARAARGDGFVVASSQGAERLRRLGVDPGAVEVALQSADLEPLPGAPRRGAGAGPGARAVRRPARAGQEPRAC